jgi:hypothetical protein
MIEVVEIKYVNRYVCNGKKTTSRPEIIYRLPSGDITRYSQKTYGKNRSQLSYGLTGLSLIRADRAQPSLHLDEYVRVRTVYIWPCGPLRKYNQASLAISISTPMCYFR